MKYVLYFLFLFFLLQGCRKESKSSQISGKKGSDTVATQKPDTGWYPIASLPGPRAYATGFSLNGKGYVGGGSPSLSAPNAAGYNDMYMYDPAKNSWTEKAWLPAVVYQSLGRNLPFSFVINNVAYAGGGMNTGGVGGNDVESYDTVKNVWATVATFGNVYSGGFGYSVAASIGGRGYIFSYDSGDNAIYTFDPRINTLVYAISVQGLNYLFSGQWLGASDTQLLYGWGNSDAPVVSIDTANNHAYHQTFYPQPSNGYTNLVNKSVVAINGIFYKNYMYVSFGDAGNLCRYNFTTDLWQPVSTRNLGVTGNAANFLIGSYLYMVGGNNATNSSSTGQAWKINLDAYP